MIDNVKLIAQSALRIEKKDGKIIYFDPFKINDSYTNDADYIFITHPHYDHFSLDDIAKIKKGSSKIIIPEELKEKVNKLNFERIMEVVPSREYIIDDITFNTIPAYNLDKEFHKKEYNWVGYVVNIDDKKIYVAGDIDNIPEARDVRCDIACIPVGGTYTMTALEASCLIKEIKPKIAIPTHYKTVVGSYYDANNFKELLKDEVDVEILMK